MIIHHIKNGRVGAITLASHKDVYLFRKGGSVHAGGQRLRIKRVDYESGALYVHAPLWWRIWQWCVR